MKNDMHIQLMKKANKLLENVNKKLDELYLKHYLNKLTTLPLGVFSASK